MKDVTSTRGIKDGIASLDVIRSIPCNLKNHCSFQFLHLVSMRDVDGKGLDFEYAYFCRKRFSSDSVLRVNGSVQIVSIPLRESVIVRRKFALCTDQLPHKCRWNGVAKRAGVTGLDENTHGGDLFLMSREIGVTGGNAKFCVMVENGNVQLGFDAIGFVKNWPSRWSQRN